MAWAGVLAIRLRPFFIFKKGVDLLDAILYEVHTPVRRRGADDDATPSSASQKRTHPQQLSLQCQSIQLHHAGLDALLQTDAFIQVAGVSAVISRAVFAAHIVGTVAGVLWRKVVPPAAKTAAR